ncbi:MAG: carbon-monoxide dehydrogenase small subunit [Gammaproteobacteria bacterium]|jgi:carbon-monoxide dehydrogenase small subunit
MKTESRINSTSNSTSTPIADASVNFTVNGQACSVTVSARTQLAEVLRDHLHLTGTHLGCEHGVCGACTVLLDGRPIRSCITYAHGCEKANVVTVEGLRDDPLGGALRAAFSRHHALQCGFCTPGMLISAWDIITRLAPNDEETIRRELSGNLCRCTGYMGIVAAVREVALAQTGHSDTTQSIGTSVTTEHKAFAPFDVDPAFLPLAPSSHAKAHSAMTHSDGFNVVERSFTIAHPVATLWELFDDLPRVATCIPGVSVDSAHGDHFSGRATIRFGPISATFAGEGTRTMEVAQRVGSIAGRGKDANGQATLDAQLRYSMSQADAADGADATTIAVSIRFRVQGGLAQFNRSDLVASFADVILAQFVDNCARLLSGGTLRTRSSMSGMTLLWQMIKAKFSR